MINTQKEQGQGFLNQRLTETASELQDVREKVKALNDRLQEAETVIRFYADPRTYGLAASSAHDPEKVYQDRVSNDYTQADNDKNTHIAGRRARRYLKTHEPE